MVRRRRCSGAHHWEAISLVPGYPARRPVGRATGGSAGKETQGRLLSLRSGKTARRHPLNIHTIGVDPGRREPPYNGVPKRYGRETGTELNRHSRPSNECRTPSWCADERRARPGHRLRALPLSRAALTSSISPLPSALRSLRHPPERCSSRLRSEW